MLTGFQGALSFYQQQSYWEPLFFYCDDTKQNFTVAEAEFLWGLVNMHFLATKASTHELDYDSLSLAEQSQFDASRHAEVRGPGYSRRGGYEDPHCGGRRAYQGHLSRTRPSKSMDRKMEGHGPRRTAHRQVKTHRAGLPRPRHRLPTPDGPVPRERVDHVGSTALGEF